MDVIHQRCAGIDISKADVKVCVRVPGPGTRRRTEVRTYSSMTRDLLAMRDWLMSERVTLVGMEATGAYWKPIFYLLESGVECWLLNARHMKTVPGRKTDVKDAEWIAKLVYVLFVLHVAGAMKHQFEGHDELQRMGIGR